MVVNTNINLDVGKTNRIGNDSNRIPVDAARLGQLKVPFLDSRISNVPVKRNLSRKGSAEEIEKQKEAIKSLVAIATTPPASPSAEISLQRQLYKTLINPSQDGVVSPQVLQAYLRSHGSTKHEMALSDASKLLVEIHELADRMGELVDGKELSSFIALGKESELLRVKAELSIQFRKTILERVQGLEQADSRLHQEKARSQSFLSDLTKQDRRRMGVFSTGRGKFIETNTKRVQALNEKQQGIQEELEAIRSEERHAHGKAVVAQFNYLQRKDSDAADAFLLRNVNKELASTMPELGRELKRANQRLVADNSFAAKFTGVERSIFSGEKKGGLKQSVEQASESSLALELHSQMTKREGFLVTNLHAASEHRLDQGRGHHGADFYADFSLPNGQVVADVGLHNTVGNILDSDIRSQLLLRKAPKSGD